ncbi:MAG: ubiquinone/menaquinone biosynthesis methyltransferase [bacterium]|nr:ubiquinone/menaquinone biosynthesis methyltransferase [bacterium]
MPESNRNVPIHVNQNKKTVPHNPAASEKAEYVRNGFDSIAANYDFLNDVMTMGLHRGWKREAVKRLGCAPGACVLDLCSGTGDLARRAAKDIGNASVTALDFSWNMMANGRRRTLAEGGRIEWIRGDATRLPFADASFDGAMVGFGLRNVTSIETALREALRVLRPGARLVNLDTAGAEWRPLNPALRFHMNVLVPLLGGMLAGDRGMYAYLASSSAAFETPEQLCALFERCGFVETGYAYRPRLVGGAALVWGRKEGG